MKTLSKPIVFKGAHEMPYTTHSLSDMSWNQTGTWRYLRPNYVEKIPACQSGCPAGEPIELWLRELETGNVSTAWEILTTENPFPGLMGRVCFHPCEKACNRKDLGGAVTINMLERSLADQHGYKNSSVKKWKKDIGKKIAVVGSGPAGLAHAFFSTRLGHSVTVFDRFPKPGGLFRYGIPEYRLPKSIVENEIKKLYDLGIKFECGKNLTRQDIENLTKSFDAVYLSLGAHISRPLGVDGENAKGVIPALNFLESAQLAMEGSATQVPACKGKNVIVIGGGNSAVDASRMAIRLGASNVTIVYRRSRVEMPAFAEEINDAEAEGVKLIMLAAPAKINAAAGSVKDILFTKMKLGDPDASGRRSPVAIPDSQFELPADIVLTAIGEIVDEQLLPQKGDKIIFGGDMLDQPRTVVNAIASGKAASIELDCKWRALDFNEVANKIGVPETSVLRMTEYLRLTSDIKTIRRENVSVKQIVVKTEHLNTYYFDNSQPGSYPKKGVTERLKPNPMMEVHSAPLAEMAKTQLERCMHCGHCTECDNCYIYCPDVSIYKAKGGYDISYDFCKGCGVCVKECPRAAMIMTEEPT